MPCALNHDSIEWLPLSYRCHKQTDDVELCISPVYRRLAVAKFFKVHNVEIVHVTLTTPT